MIRWAIDFRRRVRPMRPFLILVAGLAAFSAQAQDLAAGKSGEELFAQNCSMCHRSPRGLIKTAYAFSLNSFLRQHYTTSSRSADAIAAYLQSAGAAERAAPRGSRAEEGRPKSSRPGAEAAASAPSDRPPAQRETKSPRKHREGATAARPSEPDKKQAPAARDSPAPATAARTPESAPAPDKREPTADAPADKAAAWSPAMEALMPPPVEPAPRSGLEPGTPVNQPAFSSPLP